MNIDISNAHCGPRIQFPDHAWLRVVYVPKDCLRQCCSRENDERRETRVCRRVREAEMVCAGVGRESFSGRAPPVWTDHDAAAAAQFSLERARARAFCQIKESDYGVRAITGRSRRSARSFVGLPYASSEMRPNLFAFYRAGGGCDSPRARDEVWIAEPTACPSPRGLSSVCVDFF